MAFADLMEGPAHQPHTRLRQVGWIGHHAGAFYPWNSPPGPDQEPGGYSPCYVEDDPDD